jgi:hypothetical protein
MVRKIELNQIGSLLDHQVQTLVKAATLEATKRLKEKTPVDKGRLRNDWKPDLSEPYKGKIRNTMEYAEPVCYGTNLPPSWKGKYRTRQEVVPGFPDLIAKELEPWIKTEYKKIVRSL